MRKGYTQLGLVERRTIEESLGKGLSIGKTAKALGRGKSTVSREILPTGRPRPPRAGCRGAS